MNGVSWAMVALPVDGDAVLEAVDPDVVLPSASAGKILVLLAAADQLASGAVDPDEPLDRRSVAPVADSGVWHRLRQPTLPLDDVARLVGACSDNLATNVLLARLGGVDAVASVAARYRVRDVAMHDIVRDERTSAHPPTLSSGTAAGYAELARRLARADGIAPDVAGRVRDWLRDGVDLSMVATAFGLDPLAHQSPERGYALWNKTGTDIGTRVDVGVVARGESAVAYACLARWEPSERDDPQRDDALAGMRRFGERIRAALA